MNIQKILAHQDPWNSFSSRTLTCFCMTASFIPYWPKSCYPRLTPCDILLELVKGWNTKLQSDLSLFSASPMKLQIFGRISQTAASDYHVPQSQMQLFTIILHRLQRWSILVIFDNYNPICSYVHNPLPITEMINLSNIWQSFTYLNSNNMVNLPTTSSVNWNILCQAQCGDEFLFFW